MSTKGWYGAVSLGEGLFRKQGSTVKNWKIRKYALFSSFELTYSDTISNATKGTMNVSNVSIREGTRENTKLSSSPHKDAYAMDILSYEDSRTLEVVFDSMEEAKKFLRVLCKCSKKHNISVSKNYFLLLLLYCIKILLYTV